MTGRALIVQGDALHLPLPDASVDLVITSPPYWNLRAYGAGTGEIGSEPTPSEFLESLWAATRELVRVLKPTGSLFINLGDKYSTGNSGQSGMAELGARYAGGGHTDGKAKQPSERVAGFPPKTLLGLPWRYALGCIDGKAGDALILRAELIWSKPNGLLPESVTDRVRRSHEQWFHFTVSPRYYSATDEIREPYLPVAGGRNVNGGKFDTIPGQSARGSLAVRPPENPLGKLPGSVWTIPSEPLRLPEHLGVQHYAAFPSEWPRRLVLAFSPPGICLDCGQGRVPVVEREQIKSPVHGAGSIMGNRDGGPDERGWDGLPRFNMAATILGYACSCTPYTDHPGSGEDNGVHGGIGNVADGGWPDAGTNDNGRGHTSLQNRPKVGPWREYHLDGWKAPPTRPAVVLDPFMGTGTVLGVARQLGRIGIGTDLSHAYCRAARWRVFQSGDFGKAEARTWRDRQGALL